MKGSTFSDIKTFLAIESTTDDPGSATSPTVTNAAATTAATTTDGLGSTISPTAATTTASDPSFTFKVNESDSIDNAGDALIRRAGIAAKIASKDVDWDDLSEEFLYYARDMEVPYFEGDVVHTKAIVGMVKSICSVVSPTPYTGTRLMMLEDLQNVVEAACEKMNKESSTFSDIKTFIAIASTTDDPSFTFKVRTDSDTSDARLIRGAGIAAKKASKDIDWNHLSKEFFSVAQGMHLPYFRGDSDAVLLNCTYVPREGTVEANGSTFKVAHGATLNLFSADGISPISVTVIPPGPVLGKPLLKKDLYPGEAYYWHFDAKEGHKILEEEEYLATGVIISAVTDAVTTNKVIIANTGDVDAFHYGLGSFDGVIPKRSSYAGRVEQVGTIVNSGVSTEFWFGAPGRKAEKVIETGKKYHICPQAFNPHYALCAPRILSQEEMDSEQLETRSSKLEHDYFSGEFAKRGDIRTVSSRVGLMSQLDGDEIGTHIEVVFQGTGSMKWNIERTDSPFLMAPFLMEEDKGCYRITGTDTKKFTGSDSIICIKSGTSHIELVEVDKNDDNQIWRFVKLQDVSRQPEGQEGEIGIYLIVNAMSGRRLRTERDGRDTFKLGYTDSGVVSENEKWRIAS